MTIKVTNSKDISRRSICQLCFVLDCYVSDKRTLYLYFIVTLVMSAGSVLYMIVTLVISAHYICAL